MVKRMRWGLMRRLKRGNKLMLFLTYRCNLDCEYCSLRYIGPRVESTEIGLEDWKYIICNFPIRLREIRICGGEPLVMPYYSELVNWLIDRGLYVMVFTNLSVVKLDVIRSDQLIYDATFHKGGGSTAITSAITWERNLKTYRKYYRVNAHQIEDETIKGIKVGPKCYVEYGHTCVGFMYNPAGKLSAGFIKMLEGEYDK